MSLKSGRCILYIDETSPCSQYEHRARLVITHDERRQGGFRNKPDAVRAQNARVGRLSNNVLRFWRARRDWITRKGNANNDVDRPILAQMA